MKQSQLFGKTSREDPKDEVSANAKLLERGGFVYKTMAGVYDYLPLGVHVLEGVSQIVREEINAIGGQEALFSVLQPRERWEKSGRWEEIGDVMYQFKDHSGRDVGLGPTHEESITEIALRSIASYRDLPLAVYQIQNKFRDEPRAKSGIMRGREFLMKDLYSFHENTESLDRFYQLADKAYRKIFKRCSLEAYVTEASGGMFSKDISHEYQVLSDAGEDWTFYCEACKFAQNEEVSSLKEGDKCPKCSKGAIKGGKSIEVGNIFKLGTKFSDAFGLAYIDKNGHRKPVVMGCYGIGIGRLMGTVVEVHHDNRGIVWPDVVAPFMVHLIELRGKEQSRKVRETVEKLYRDFLAKGIAVLYDDRVEKTVGERFADADLIGIPWRVVVSEKTIEAKGVELKRRKETKSRVLTAVEVLKRIQASAAKQ